MTREEFESHHFEKDETVLYRGKPVKVLTSSPRSLMLQLDRNHYVTVLPVEVELVDGSGGVETR